MSSKTVADKLLIKPNTTVWVSDASHLKLLQPLPDKVRKVGKPEEATTALVFADDMAMLREILDAHKDKLAQPTTFWVAYPKANRTDIKRDTLWPVLGDYGMRPLGYVAVDEVWSAMRFRPNREGEERFTGGGQK